MLLLLTKSLISFSCAAFVKDVVDSAQGSIQNLLDLEYEASKTRVQLEGLHRLRLECHQELQLKRDQITADIQQYLQSFSTPVGLPTARR